MNQHHFMESVDGESGHTPAMASTPEVAHDLACSKNVVKPTRPASKPIKLICHLFFT